MTRRQTCYFCTSTFQLFSVISLAVTRKEQADLYIDPQFKDAARIAARIRKLGLFGKVRIINSEKIYNRFYTHRDGFINHLEIAKNYLHVDRIAAMILGEDVCYNNVFVSSKAYMPRMVILHYIKHRLRFRINYFDDGIGSYLDDRAYQPKKADIAVRKALFGSRAVKLDHDLYLLSPELYRKINPNSSHRLFGIKQIWKNIEWIRRLNYIFSIGEIQPLTQKAVILGQIFGELFDDQQADIMKGIYRTVSESFGKENTILKKHPRSSENDIQGLECYPDYGIPFEMICMNNSISDKVLIAYTSTAAGTPKTLLDKEPYLILLYKLAVPKNGLWEAVDEFYKNIKSIYSHPERVMIPESLDELKEYLNRLNAGSI